MYLIASDDFDASQWVPLRMSWENASLQIYGPNVNRILGTSDFKK